MKGLEVCLDAGPAAAVRSGNGERNRQLGNGRCLIAARPFRVPRSAFHVQRICPARAMARASTP